METVAKAETRAGSEKVAVAKVGGVTVAGAGTETMTVSVAKAGGATVAGPVARAAAGATAPPP